MQVIHQARKRYLAQIRKNNPENLSNRSFKYKNSSCNRERSLYDYYEAQKSKSQLRNRRISSIPDQLPLLKQSTDLLASFFSANKKKNIQKKKYSKAKKFHEIGGLGKSYHFQFSSQTYQGLRDYNQDRIFIKTNIEIHQRQYFVFAIFDGHGGSSTSQYLKIHFCKTFEKFLKDKENIQQSLELSLIEMQSKISQFGNKILSGSCATICIIHEKDYLIANVGDSRIIKISHNGKFSQITNDHKPEIQKQKQRIQKQGGRVYRDSNYNYATQEKNYGPYRIFPSKLSISRTIGDNQFKKKNHGNILSSAPDFFSGKLQPCDILVLMSDGGYQKFSNFEIADIFHTSSANISQKVKQFIRKCQIRSTFDNVSVIGIQMNSCLTIENF